MGKRVVRRKTYLRVACLVLCLWRRLRSEGGTLGQVVPTLILAQVFGAVEPYDAVYPPDLVKPPDGSNWCRNYVIRCLSGHTRMTCDEDGIEPERVG